MPQHSAKFVDSRFARMTVEALGAILLQHGSPFPSSSRSGDPYLPQHSAKFMDSRFARMTGWGRRELSIRSAALGSRIHA